MKQLLTLLCIAICTASFAQPDGYVSLGSRETIIGTYADNTPVKSVQYDLPFGTYAYVIDSQRKEIILLLRNGEDHEGYLMVYDVNTNAFKWKKEVEAFRMVYGKNNVILVRGHKAVCLDRNTGEQLWYKPYSNVKYIDDRNGIALTDSCNAMDLRTGEVLWSRWLPGLANWDELTYLDDTTVVLICDGLRRINLKTGKAYNLFYKTQLAQKALLRKEAFTLSIGVQFGVLGGIAAGAIINNSAAPSKIGSTILLEDDKIYATAKNKILCINGTADKILWEAKLPSNIAADFSFFTNGNNMILISEGIARNSEGAKVKVSQSFFAAFRKTDGEKAYAKMVGEDENDFFSDYKVSNDTLTLLFSNTIYQYNIKTGEKLFQKKNDLKPYAEYTYFMDTSIVYRSAPDSSYKKIAALYDQVNFLTSTNKSKVIGYNAELTEVAAIDKNDLGYKYTASAGFDLLRSGERTIIARDGKKLGELNATQGWLYNNRLYVIDKGSFKVIDLSGML